MRAYQVTEPTILSAGIVPVRRTDGDTRFLLLRCYRYWDFPKGEVDRGEEPLAAAQRELTEETGLRRLDFRWGQDFIETERYGRGKIARYYIAEAPVGEVTLPVNPQLGRAEHQEHRWTSAAEARRLLNARLLRVLDWACSRLQQAPDQD
jgi:8-oxo-dGTP pyrophosphatase MutT (NUDIX family)